MKYKNHYQVLNISPRASDEDVRGAYYALARRWHPDRNPHNRKKSEAHFIAIGKAYAMLKTKPQRDAYNRHLLKLKAANTNKAPAVRKKKDNLFSALREILWPFTSGITRHG